MVGEEESTLSHCCTQWECDPSQQSQEGELVATGCSIPLYGENEGSRTPMCSGPPSPGGASLLMLYLMQATRLKPSLADSPAWQWGDMEYAGEEQDKASAFPAASKGFTWPAPCPQSC